MGAQNSILNSDFDMSTIPSADALAAMMGQLASALASFQNSAPQENPQPQPQQTGNSENKNSQTFQNSQRVSMETAAAWGAPLPFRPLSASGAQFADRVRRPLRNEQLETYLAGFPLYEGLPEAAPQSRAPEDRALSLAQRRIVAILHLLCHSWEDPATVAASLSRVAAVAATSFAELQGARRRALTRGRPNVLNIERNDTNLLTEEEERRMHASSARSSGRGRGGGFGRARSFSVPQRDAANGFYANGRGRRPYNGQRNRPQDDQGYQTQGNNYQVNQGQAHQSRGFRGRGRSRSTERRF